MIVIESLDYFTIKVSNLDKAIKFYKDMLGFDVAKTDDETEAFLKIGDMTIRLVLVEGYQADEDSAPIVAFYVDEDDFEEAIADLENEEIAIIAEDESFVVFADLDGNNIEIHCQKVF